MIEVRNIRGLCRGKDTDTTMDGIYIVDALHPNGNMVGLAGRQPGAAVQLLVAVSESVLREIVTAMDDRDFGHLSEMRQSMAQGQRAIEGPPTITDDKGEEDTTDDDTER